MATITKVLANYSDVEALQSELSIIGTILTLDKTDDADRVSVPSNGSAGKSLGSLTLPVGTWIITGGVRFPGNSTGIRRMMISTSSTSSSISPRESAQASVVGSGTESLTKTLIVPLTRETTYHLVALQNSGEALLCYGYMRAIRIK